MLIALYYSYLLLMSQCSKILYIWEADLRIISLQFWIEKLWSAMLQMSKPWQFQPFLLLCKTLGLYNISLPWGAVAVHFQLNGLSELHQFRSKIADLQICRNGMGSASQLVCGYILWWHPDPTLYNLGCNLNFKTI